MLLVGSVGALIVGFLLTYGLVDRLVARGLDADAQGTAGYTSAADVAQGVVGVVLAVLGVSLVVYSIARLRRGSGNP